MNIKIVYETQSGTTQYVAEIIQQTLQTAGHQVTLHSVKSDGFEPSFEGVDAVIFGGPTYDDGKLEHNLADFTQKFQPDLSKLKVTVFGLGNSSYPHFCTSASLLEGWVKQRGGKLVTESLMVDGFPDDTTAIEEYAQRVSAALSA